MFTFIALQQKPYVHRYYIGVKYQQFAKCGLLISHTSTYTYY